LGGNPGDLVFADPFLIRANTYDIGRRIYIEERDGVVRVISTSRYYLNPVYITLGESEREDRRSIGEDHQIAGCAKCKIQWRFTCIRARHALNIKCYDVVVFEVDFTFFFVEHQPHICEG